MDEASNIASQLPSTLTSISFDFVIIGILFAIVFFVVWQRGIANGGATLVAVYIAGFLFQNVPLERILIFEGSAGMVIFSQIAIFAVIFAVVWWLVARTLLLSLGGGGTSLFISLGLAAGIVLLLITYSYHLINIEALYNFGPLLDSVFAPETHFLWLLLAPLAVLLFV